MLQDTLFWLGLVGLVGGIGIGVYLLEDEGDVFVRNAMFSTIFACLAFIYLTVLGEKTPATFRLFGLSFFIGGLAMLPLALAAGGSLRAAFLAGGLAGTVLQVMIKVFPPGSVKIASFHDIPTVIDLSVAMLVGAGVYYLFRNWGKGKAKWD
jgi:hypothetical protein